MVELGHERVADLDQALELARLALQVLYLPDPAQDARGLRAELLEGGYLLWAERGRLVPVQADDAQDKAVVAQERRGHLGEHPAPQGPVAGVRGGLGNVEGAPVKGDPSGNPLARHEGAVAVGGQPEVSLHLEQSRVGIEKEDAPAVRRQGRAHGLKDLPQGEGGLIGGRGERGHRVKRCQNGRVAGLGHGAVLADGGRCRKRKRRKATSRRWPPAG